MDEAMTTATDATRVFAVARAMYDSALRQLDATDVRDAAEKARWAARRATDALILARPANCRRSRPTPPGPCDNWQWTSQQYVACGAATLSAKTCCTATASTQAFASRSRTLDGWSERQSTTYKTRSDWRASSPFRRYATKCSVEKARPDDRERPRVTSHGLDAARESRRAFPC